MFDATTVTTDLPDIPGEVLPDVPDLPGDIPDEIPGDVPQGEPQEAHDAHVLVPDAVLDPEALIPSSSILARVKAHPMIIAAGQRRDELRARAALFPRILTDDAQMAQADALRDEMADHATLLDPFFAPLCEAANALHRGCTGMRAFCGAGTELDPDKKALGDKIAARIRANKEAEERRQREAREKAAEEERARLKAEAEENERKAKALEAEAATATTRDEAVALEQAAAEAQITATQARVDAAHVSAPAVAAQPVAAPENGSDRDNWKALPAHAEEWDTKHPIPLADKCQVILFVADKLRAGDRSFVNLLDVVQKVANTLAKGQNVTFNVPGLRAVNPPSYSKRRG